MLLTLSAAPARDQSEQMPVGAEMTIHTDDPAEASWHYTGRMVSPRSSHTATLLRNGKVLVAGGADDAGELSSAELYDPVSKTWTATASLSGRRSGHTATLLRSHKVLVA